MVSTTPPIRRPASIFDNAIFPGEKDSLDGLYKSNLPSPNDWPIAISSNTSQLSFFHLDVVLRLNRVWGHLSQLIDQSMASLHLLYDQTLIGTELSINDPWWPPASFKGWRTFPLKCCLRLAHREVACFSIHLSMTWSKITPESFSQSRLTVHGSSTLLLLFLQNW